MSGHVWRDALPTSICKGPVLQHKTKVGLARAVDKHHNATRSIKATTAGGGENFCIMQYNLHAAPPLAEATLPAVRSACLKSSLRSLISSRPTEIRIKSSVRPADAIASAERCEWVVEPG